MASGESSSEKMKEERREEKEERREEKEERREEKEEVVISGFSGKFPNCDSIAEFEHNLFNGIEHGHS